MRIRQIQKRLAALTEYQDLIIEQPEQFRGSWCETFGGKRLFIEVGTGKGMFLTETALKFPSDLFIGIELFAPVLATAARRVRERAISNVKFINANVNKLLDFFADSEVHSIYINFVDPWPKKKHEKRRLTHPQFLSIFKQVMQLGGEIQLKTDNEGLFEYSLNQFSDTGFRLRDITLDLHRSVFAEQNIWTEYETRYAEQGLRIYRCLAIHERPMAVDTLDRIDR